MAASRTLRVIGPAVSGEAAMKIMPDRLTNPTVGFSPTMPQVKEGDRMDPSVSVPTATTQRFAATAAADPEFEPEVLQSSAYGLRACPRLPLQPLVDVVERILAHSLRFVLPKITQPAARSRATTAVSRGGFAPITQASPWSFPCGRQ
jgi:hypothetical protein